MKEKKKNKELFKGDLPSQNQEKEWKDANFFRCEYGEAVFQREFEALKPALYLVSTPIGNLEDITLRALRILQKVDLIAAEDTRTARKLLSAYSLNAPLMSLYRDNEEQRIPQIIERLKRGEAIALISEAGTPALSDPGFQLIRQTRLEHLPIVPVPGASAALPALISSGLPCDHFLFLGFLPTRSGKRRQFLEPYRMLPTTLIFYVAPHNALDILVDLERYLGDRPAFLARELTKQHEEHLTGSLSELYEILKSREKLRGEFVLIVAGYTDKFSPLKTDEAQEKEALQKKVAELLETGAKPAKLARQLTKFYPHLSRKEAYEIILKKSKKE